MANATHILSGAIKVTTDASSVFGANIVLRPVDGAKGTRVSFSTIVSGSVGGAGGVVSGSRIAKSNLAAAQGDIYSTQDFPSTFVAITNGSGRYCVRSVNDDTAPLFFTRLGDFQKQADGTFKNSAGQYLCGINYQDDGSLPPGGINLQNLKIVRAPSIASQAIATTEVSLKMQLPAVAPTLPDAPFNATIIDSLGVAHSATLTFTKQVAPLTWNLTSVTFADSSTISAPALPVAFTFNAQGAIASIGASNTGGQPANLAFTCDFSANGASNAQAVTLKCGTFGIVGGLTQNGGTPNPVVYSVVQNGTQPSDAIGDEIDQNGTLYTRFNGSSKLRERAQIVLAQFGNVNELGNANGTTQVMKVEAGDFTLQIPNKGNGGSLVPNHLEKSTTDSTQEYVYLLDNVNQQSILVAGLKHSMEADRALTTL